MKQARATALNITGKAIFMRPSYSLISSYPVPAVYSKFRGRPTHDRNRTKAGVASLIDEQLDRSQTTNFWHDRATTRHHASAIAHAASNCSRRVKRATA